MASGPAMNILLAFVILLGVSVTYGVYRSQLTISKVQECIVVANAADQSCAGKPPTPAAQSGIQPGDKIVAFNGTPVSSWDDVSRLIRANLDQPGGRDGRAGWPDSRPQAGQYRDHRRTGQIRPVEAGCRGVLWGRTRDTPAARWSSRRHRRHVANDQADRRGTRLLPGEGLLHGLQPGDWQASRRLRTDVDRRRKSGGGEIAATNQISPAAKLASLFTVLGSVNLFVALFNFVPLLPLDGGHVAAAMYEAIRRSLRSRLRAARPRIMSIRQGCCRSRTWSAG